MTNVLSTHRTGIRKVVMRRFVALAAVSLVPLLSGCMFELASGTVTGARGIISLQGGVVGTPITGPFQATYALAPSPVPLPLPCIWVAGGVRLTDAAGNTLTKQESGQLCPNPTSSGSTFSGTYTITGGTGIYQGATGTGTSTFQLSSSSSGTMFTSQQIGTFQVPGTGASAASRRTFKMRGTVASAKLCEGVGNSRISNQPRRCKRVGVAELRQTAGLAIGS